MDMLAIGYWQRAAQDLGLDVVAPFRLTLSDGASMEFVALVKSFGTPGGMLVHTDYDALKPYTQRLKEDGYGWSAMPGISEDSYTRQGAIDVLNDWGWTGEKGLEPKWYSGAYWGQDVDELKGNAK